MIDSVKPKPEKATPYAWVILIILALASMVVCMTQFKVAPLYDWLGPAFNMDLTAFGLLMSSLTIFGVILAFPASWICGKFGLKNAIIIAVGLVGCGSLLGALTNSIELLFLSRALEGCGIAFSGVAAPTAISVWFPEARRGLPLAIWGACMPLGTAIMMITAPQAALAFNDWRVVWWICFIAAALILVLVLILFKMPKDYAAKESQIHQQGSIKAGFKHLKNKEIWLLCLAFFCFNLIANGVFQTFYPTFMQNSMGFSATDAGAATAVLSLLTIVVMPIMGGIYDGLKKRKIFVLAGFVLSAFILAFAFQAADAMVVWVCIVLLGIAGGFVASGTRPMTPEIMEKKGLGAFSIAMGMGVMQIAQNLGPTVGAPLFGASVEAFGWFTSALIICVPAAIIAFVSVLFIKAR